MKQQYIRSLAEAYVIDNKLYKENLTPEELFENFYGLIKDARINQPNLYNVLVESNKFEQQKIFTNYFDIMFKQSDFVLEDVDLENLNEFGDPITLGTIVGWLVNSVITFIAFKTRKPLTKGVLQTINGLTSVLNKIGKTMAATGSSTQLAYAIIQKNSKKCYDMCDFDPKDAGPEDYMLQHGKGGILRTVGRIFQSEKSEEKMDCLRSCYLSTMKEIVKLTAHSYFTCLKNTGDLSRLPLERDFSAYQQVLVNSGLNQTCDSLAGNLKDAFNSFNSVLDLIYDDEPVEARKHRMELMLDIYNLQKEASGTNKFQVKTFPPKQITADGQKSQFQSRPPFQKR
jgi:hypothetical protein